MTYDPKFTQKQMYDQYGSSRETTKKADPKPSRSSGFGGMGSDPAEQFGGSPTRGIGAKPPSNTFGGGQDNNPNRDEYENKSTIDKVKEKAVDLFKSFGAKEPEALIVDGKRVYQGPLFSGYDPTVRIGPFGGDAGKKQYRLGMPILGEVSPSYPSPTLPSGSNNPTLNMFGVRRGFTGGTDMPDLSVSPEAPANMDPLTRVLSQAMLPTEVNYTIQDGDTLSEIAKDADTTVEELKELNNIENIDEIDAGANLKIPVKAGKLTDTQAALRRGLDRDKNNEGIQTALNMSEVDINNLSQYSTDELVEMLRSFTNKMSGETEVKSKGQDKKIAGLGAKQKDLIDTSPRTQGELLDTEGVNSIDFNDELLDDLVDLEGRGGDFLSSTPTYDLGITESKANEYNLDPNDYTTFGKFAKDFTKQYVDEKYLENKDIFKTVDKENHTALMSYLWNVGSFGTNQTTALEDNDMREFVAEMKDAVGSEGFSSSGLSARRAKEANMIGENLDDWNPIVKVVITGTRANPTFTWEDADGNTVEEYTTTRSLHPQNVKNKPNANDVLNEEIDL